LHGFREGFSIFVIILISLYKGAHELGWNQAHLMPLCYQSGAQVMSTTARFHSNQTGWCVGKLAEQLAPRGSPLQDHVSRLVQPNQVKDGFSKINADGVYVHAVDDPPLDITSKLAPHRDSSQSGGPSH
jgi:hypothetical protein